jgi:BirA family biotin operon repressor/biotin-[acetyl-CoA-carboxylase] ligase
LHDLGISYVRLRWPNDVLVDERKLAGLLIDQFVAGRAVVGVGLNVKNQPEKCDPNLANHVARLADLLSNPPELADLARLFLAHLKRVVIELADNGSPSLFLRINRLWGVQRTVELDLNGQLCCGTFKGLDAEGRLILVDQSGSQSFYDAHEVRHLTELRCLP